MQMHKGHSVYTHSNETLDYWSKPYLAIYVYEVFANMFSGVFTQVLLSPPVSVCSAVKTFDSEF